MLSHFLPESGGGGGGGLVHSSCAPRLKFSIYQYHGRGIPVNTQQIFSNAQKKKHNFAQISPQILPDCCPNFVCIISLKKENGGTVTPPPPPPSRMFGMVQLLREVSIISNKLNLRFPPQVYLNSSVRLYTL